jgi:hypothetical protein
MSGLLWIFLLGLVVASPLILWWAKNPVFDKKSFAIATIGTALVAMLPLFGIGNHLLVWQLLVAQTLLFVSYVFVSRTRQRKSLFLIALMSVFSNGGWFLTMFVLATAYTHAQKTLQGLSLSVEFFGFLAAITAGTLGGRLVGVQWMQFVEQRFGIRSNSVKSETLTKLDLKTIPFITWALVLMVVVGLGFGIVQARDMFIVVTLGLLQNLVYSVNTRLANRDHPGWPVVTGLLATVIFIVHWAYLLKYSAAGGSMPLVLLIPYTLATLTGSTIGARLSMSIEDVLGLKPDKHVVEEEKKKKEESKVKYKGIKWHHTLLTVVAVLSGIYLAWNEAILAWLGIAPQAIIIPFASSESLLSERMLSLLFGGLIFFLNSATFTLMSRAGNRNHAVYHATLCVLLGFMSFWYGSFVVLNARFLDLIPIAAFGSALGQLYGQQFSMWMEKKLNSVMDVEPEKKPA